MIAPAAARRLDDGRGASCAANPSREIGHHQRTSSSRGKSRTARTRAFHPLARHMVRSRRLTSGGGCVSRGPGPRMLRLTPTRTASGSPRGVPPPVGGGGAEDGEAERPPFHACESTPTARARGGASCGGAAVPRPRGQEAAEPRGGTAGLVVSSARKIVHGPPWAAPPPYAARSAGGQHPRRKQVRRVFGGPGPPPAPCVHRHPPSGATRGGVDVGVRPVDRARRRAAKDAPGTPQRRRRRCGEGSARFPSRPELAGAGTRAPCACPLRRGPSQAGHPVHHAPSVRRDGTRTGDPSPHGAA